MPCSPVTRFLVPWSSCMAIVLIACRIYCAFSCQFVKGRTFFREIEISEEHLGILSEPRNQRSVLYVMSVVESSLPGKADTWSLYSDSSDDAPLLEDLSRRMTLTWENLSVEVPPAKPPLIKRKSYKPLKDPEPILQNSRLSKFTQQVLCT